MATKESDNEYEKVKSEVVMERPMPWQKLDESYEGASVGFQCFVSIAFWSMFLVQLGLLIAVFTSPNTSGSFEARTLECGSETYAYFGHELDSGLKADYCACQTTVSNNGGRRLSASNSTEYLTMFDLMEEYVYIPITGCVIVFVLGGIWLELMKKFGTSFIWISLLSNLAIMVTMSVLLFTYEASGAAVVILLFSAAFLSYLVFRRSVITRAGGTLETATKALGKNPCVFGVLLPLEAAYVGWIFLWLEGWTHATRAMEIEYNEAANTCGIVMQSGPFGYMWFISFIMLWVSFYVSHAKVNVVAASLAAWTFGQESSFTCNLPLKALRWSFFESSPTLSLTSLICTFIERIKSTVENKCNWANPFCCCLMLIGTLVVNTLQAFGRFTVVLHAITAKPFYESAYHSYRLLIKGGHLEHAIASDFFVKFSLMLFAYVLSIGMGFVMWAWIDDASNLESLNPSGSWQGWFWFFFILFIVMNRYPYLSIFVVSLLGNWQWLADETDGKASAVLLAIFAGAISHLIFQYFADIVLDSVDTMVMCYAIDKQNGLVAAEYASKKDEVVATLYLTFDDLVAKKTEGVAAPKSPGGALAADSVATAMPVSMQKVQVIVPEGVKPGQMIQATAPDGTTFQITVPAGVAPGTVLEAEVPSV